MKYLHRLALLPILLAAASGAGAADLTESDFFSALPEVLTVTRLAQPQAETPGAMTIIDRETIRRSGAREVVDVLRLVPGYLVSGWNGANPNAVYHAPIDDYGTRNLVLIDGRPVYSSFQLGDTHRGMMGVLLEDIERIEVLRGANSAAYGANAMFGVINIITRNAADTHGAVLSATGGGAGIRDGMARVGWGDPRASFRLSAGQRADNGYGNAYDDKKVRQAHFRGDLRPDNENEIAVSAGMAEIFTGEGFAGDLENAERTNRVRNWYVHGVWQKTLADGQALRLNVSYDQEQLYDYSEFDMALFGCGAACVGPVRLDYGGTGRRLNVEFQHTAALAKGWRGVWGAAFKREQAESVALYHRPKVSFDRMQLFGNLEWRASPWLLLNAGGLWERHSDSGAEFAPRLAANVFVQPGHTLRLVANRSFRPPTLFELKGDVRYYNSLGEQMGQEVLTTGDAKAEILDVLEIGYLAEIRKWNLTLDARAFRERLLGPLSTRSYELPVSFPLTGSRTKKYINRYTRNGLTRGLDYQLRWNPGRDTEIWINQSWQHFVWDDDWDNHLPPTRTTTLALFQKLSAGIDLSVQFHALGPVTWRSDEDILPSTHRLDLRLAYPFRIGATRVEAALTVQAANGDVPEFQATEGFRFERRAYGTLRIEF